MFFRCSILVKLWRSWQERKTNFLRDCHDIAGTMLEPSFVETWYMFEIDGYRPLAPVLSRLLKAWMLFWSLNERQWENSMSSFHISFKNMYSSKASSSFLEWEGPLELSVVATLQLLTKYPGKLQIFLIEFTDRGILFKFLGNRFCEILSSFLDLHRKIWVSCNMSQLFVWSTTNIYLGIARSFCTWKIEPLDILPFDLGHARSYVFQASWSGLLQVALPLQVLLIGKKEPANAR